MLPLLTKTPEKLGIRLNGGANDPVSRRQNAHVPDSGESGTFVRWKPARWCIFVGGGGRI